MKEASFTSSRWSSRFHGTPGYTGPEYTSPEYMSDAPPVRHGSKTHAHEECEGHCPYCHQRMDRTGLTVANLLIGGFRQLCFALFMIAVAVVRCLRFVAAAALCLIGLLGAWCRALGLQIAHAHDRGFLEKL